MKRIICILFALFISNCSEKHQVKSISGNEIDTPSTSGSRYPYLHSSGKGMSMSWLQQLDSTRFALQVSIFEEGKWSTAETVASSDQFFVNWADFPSLVTHKGKIIAAHWLQKVPGGTYAYHVKLSFRNTDGSWTQAISPHTDNTSTEHGFVSLLALDQDHVLAVWLDGRHTTGGGHDNHNSHGKAADEDISDLSTAMTLRSAVIGRDGRLSNEHEIDASVCDCCQTSLVATPTGAMVIYRNRNEYEIRDIAISRYNLRTHTWSAPEILHNDDWKINGCPVNGPRLAARNNSIVAVWFTMTEDTPMIKAMRSDNGGEHFGEVYYLDQKEVSGRVDVVIDQNEDAWISWIAQKEGASVMAMRQLSKQGKLSHTSYLSEISPKRGSGFPRMVWTDSGLMLAWTQVEPEYSIKMMNIQPQKR
jgi:hypothetical protein